MRLSRYSKRGGPAQNHLAPNVETSCLVEKPHPKQAARLGD